MKKSLTWLFFFVIYISARAQTVYPSGVNGCIARWTFDTTETSVLINLPDLSGNNHSGTTNNVGSTFGFRNKPFSAGDFNGTSSWAEVPHALDLNPTNISIISLVKFNQFYTGLCQGNNIIYKGFDYNSNLSWAMYVSDIDGDCNNLDSSVEKMSFRSPSSSAYTPPLSDFIHSNKWYFLATTFDGSQVKYYQVEMDTAFKESNILPDYVNNGASPLGNSTHNVFLGATQNPPFKYWFNGSMDEVILFNKALSNLEIQSVYDYLWGVATGNSNLEKNILINPYIFGNNLYINSSDAQIAKIEIYDINGRKLLETNEKFTVIDVSKLASQLMFMKIYLKSNVCIVRKVIK